jgi:hypothetical protein
VPLTLFLTLTTEQGYHETVISPNVKGLTAKQKAQHFPYLRGLWQGALLREPADSHLWLLKTPYLNLQGAKKLKGAGVGKSLFCLSA